MRNRARDTIRMRVSLAVAAVFMLPAGLPSYAADKSAGACPESEQTSIDSVLAASDCYRASGYWVRAIELLQSAEDLPPEDIDTDKRIALLARLAQLYTIIGATPSAFQVLETGLRLAEQESNGIAAAGLLNDLGRLQVERGATLEAIDAFADAHRLAPAGSNIRVNAGINLSRAVFESQSADTINLSHLDVTTAEIELLPDPAQRIHTWLAAGELYREIALVGGDAVSLQRRAHAALKAGIEQAVAADDSLQMSYGFGYLARLYADTGDVDTALKYTRQALWLAQKVDAPQSAYLWAWQSARLQREADLTTSLRTYRLAISLLEDARTGEISISKRRFAHDIAPLYFEFADLSLSEIASNPDADLGEVIKALEQLKVAEVRNYFENQCLVPEADDRPLQIGDEALIVYPVVFDDRLELLIEANGVLSHATVAVSREELINEIRMFRLALESPESGDDAVRSARNLHRYLIDPLQSVLASTSASTIVFVPDGALRTIPFAALYDGETYLVERYAIATTPGLSLIGGRNGDGASGRVLAVGLTESVRGFSPLPHVGRELDVIGEEFPARIYRDTSFVVGKVEDEVLDGDYSIVHIATHGVFQADYRRSFLLAYDDVISMDQLEATVGIQRLSDQPIDLIVLSACQTAAGDDGAALGLAGIAVKAGARSALASLWLINDESTADLMAAFYGALRSEAMSKAAALQKAQRVLIDSDTHRHPNFWAPFILVGDWR